MFASNSPETTDKASEDLRRFRGRCLLFAMPLFVLFLPATTILVGSGECLVDIDRIVDRSQQEQLLVGFAYKEGNYGYLKYRRLMSLPPQSVVALGSSRVLGFRENMFTGSFYNAGFTIVSPWDFRTFLAQLPDSKLPEVLITGFDQFMFNSENNASRPPRPATTWTTAKHEDLQSTLKLVPDVYKDLARGKVDVGQLWASWSATSTPNQIRPIGLNGVLNQQGFRNDGSMRYGRQVELLLNNNPQARDFQFADTLNRIKRGRNRFNWGSEPDSAAIAEIDRFLKECSRRRVHVVAFLPPYADAVWAEMASSGNFKYLQKLESALHKSFQRYGFELYSFHSMSACQATDMEAIDGFHAGENVYLKMLAQMLEQGSVLNQYASAHQLKADQNNTVDRFTAYAESGRSASEVAKEERSADVKH